MFNLINFKELLQRKSIPESKQKHFLSFNFMEEEQAVAFLTVSAENEDVRHEKLKIN